MNCGWIAVAKVANLSCEADAKPSRIDGAEHLSRTDRAMGLAENTAANLLYCWDLLLTDGAFF